jgi:hypothetical protein
MHIIRLSTNIDCSIGGMLLTSPEKHRIPNEETAEAMRELEDGKGEWFESVEDLFRDLDLGE